MLTSPATGDYDNNAAVELHKDSNGNLLQNGDTVILTKSLDVKGTTLNAKMGTVVKNIRLVEDNTEQIEDKIEGQVILILTKYVRKHEGFHVCRFITLTKPPAIETDSPFTFANC